jgi:Ser/Thr protein kinase RdoA (MazF antagonist)
LVLDCPLQRGYRHPMTPAEIATQFNVRGQLVAVMALGSGNVNDTYRAVFRTTSDEQQFVLQRINRHVFPQPEKVMANMRAVTEYAHRRIRVEAAEADRIWQLPRVISTRGGQDFYKDPETGEVWRALSMIASAYSHEKVETVEHAVEAGQVLGHFQRIISDFAVDQMEDTLPGFHIAPRYLAHFDEVLTSAEGKRHRDASTESKRLAKFIEGRRAFIPVLEDALARGDLRQRPIHGDPKITNIMIDEITGKGTAIVDLDTVKPGLIHYDFGDAARSACNPAGEETPNLEDVFFDTDLFEGLVRGYFREAAPFLTEQDRAYLYDSVRLIALELGMRFYTDYLEGNRYFKVKHAQQNLERARVQLKLCESIEAREGSIRRTLERYGATDGRTN